MTQYYAVIDTNVIVSALLSSNPNSPTVALLDLISADPSLAQKGKDQLRETRICC